MNENLDLRKILKECPKGTKFYCTIYGEVSFLRIENSGYPIRYITSKNVQKGVTSKGINNGLYDGECILFPSKDQRDWSKFERFWDKKSLDKPVVEKFDPKTLHCYDKVLAKDGFSSKWTCTFFSHMDNDASFPVYCSGGYFKVCIPYNEETKHLLGTTDDCPEYYKWWEE